MLSPYFLGQDQWAKLDPGYQFSTSQSAAQYSSTTKTELSISICNKLSYISTFYEVICLKIRVLGRNLTGNPTVMLRSEILLVPALRSTGPVNVNCLRSLLPKAEPVLVKKPWSLICENQGPIKLHIRTKYIIPEYCPLMKTWRKSPADCTVRIGFCPPLRYDSDGLISTLRK